VDPESETAGSVNAKVMTFEPIPAKTRQAHVAEALRDAILNGQLPPGAQVIETQLAAQFRVSRGPLREAMRDLVRSGLLENRPYAGTFVTKADARLVENLYAVRTPLEKLAFELIWPRRDAAFRAELLRRHDELQVAIDEGGPAEQITSEMRFHGLAYEVSGNGVLLEAWRNLADRIRLCFLIHQRSFRPQDAFRGAHDAYLACALGDDLDLMKAEIERHIDKGLETAKAFFLPAANG
jgi:DNA-binding GntR family transcriptional regulator